jgi:hypothetical protein
MKKPKPFIPVGQLAKAFSPESFALPLSGELAGKQLKLHFEDGAFAECSFETMNMLVWKPASGAKSSQATEEACTVTRVRKSIYFVDFVKHLERATTLTLVLDLSRGIFTAVEGRLPKKKEVRQDLLRRVDAGRELTDVGVAFLHGAIDRSFGPATPRHNATEELVGKRIEYTYSPTERYEHIYLNGSFYTWHCLLGAEKGLADTDCCHSYKLARHLYLFVWREKIVPTLGVVVLDLNAMRTTGKIFGYESNDFRKVVNFRIGARARLRSITPAQDGRRKVLHL